MSRDDPGETPKLTALVLAGSREGRADPMAVAAGVAHKALLPVAGVPMLLRVLQAMRASPEIGRIVVAAQGADDLLASIAVVPGTIGRDAAGSPSGTVATMLEEFGTPLLVTTADHALLTPSMLSWFVAHCSDPADAVAAVAGAETILAAYPDTRRTWLRFSDGRVSGCNLFMFRTDRATNVVEFWRSLEHERKRPLSMAWLVGPVALLAYMSRLVTLGMMVRLLGRRTGTVLGVVRMPFAEAAIDVDTPADLILVESIIRTAPAG